ncbi:molybdopterin-dependent oxidoreductase [Arthrobacter sp. FW306-07-I]|uniref:molybdopterin-dependent oxidoreductase n=1 Tax=Arthrobacter sp. FW306-07-I TaxID=2879622 RepID=UPI001F16C5F4|nr:molybdopterin-dependent oxidoreductase [Arthrobacter sp. FW306-07-I]UKA77127.1 molybdopterin-dependent oxidoreductase [Arthrobacter sp. FW306-07-I]
MPEFFPAWVVITHFLNLALMLMLFRSGIEVLSAFPKLYWHDDCPPGRQWLRLSKKNFGPDSRKPWSSLDEEESWSPVVALPGRKNLGLGRHWHFMTVQFWILTGVVYVVTMFVTGYWQYIVPTHWSIIPGSLKAVGTYLQFELPAKIPGEPFEPAQKLAYFVVIFIMAPLQILTGAAMSPSVLARFPRYGKLFGGKQGARSLHFLIMCAFAAFTVVHVFLVVIHGLPQEFAAIVLGNPNGDRRLATGIGLAGLLAIVMLHVVITWFSLRYRRRTQRILGRLVNPFERVISRASTSRQHFSRSKISPYFRVNGYPPPTKAYEQMAANGFRDYRLTVGGLVAEPMRFSLPELRDLGEQRQITKHNCIQGWTAIAEWAGIPLSDVMQLVKPHPEAKYVVFYGMDDKGLTEGEGRYGFYYTTIPIYLAWQPQALLALEMNGAPLPIEHGAPLRLRLETQLGFKMIKWVQGIEFVTEVKDIGMGMGGWREDQQFYANAAGI